MLTTNTVTYQDLVALANIAADPGLLQAEEQFMEVVARLWREDAEKRVRHALDRLGVAVVFPSDLQPA